MLLLLAVSALAITPLGIAHAQTQDQLTVTSQDLSSKQINGYYTVLSQSGNAVATGFTPATFTLNAGQSYVVQVDDYVRERLTLFDSKKRQRTGGRWRVHTEAWFKRLGVYQLSGTIRYYQKATAAA